MRRHFLMKSVMLEKLICALAISWIFHPQTWKQFGITSWKFPSKQKQTEEIAANRLKKNWNFRVCSTQPNRACTRGAVSGGAGAVAQPASRPTAINGMGISIYHLPGVSRGDAPSECGSIAWLMPPTGMLLTNARAHPRGCGWHVGLSDVDLDSDRRAGGDSAGRPD
jgi:hypothetical protein